MGVSLPAVTDSSGARSPRRDRRGGSRLRGRLSLVVAVLLGAPALLAPLLCGAVHPQVLHPLLGVVAVLALATAVLARTSPADLRPGPVRALPLVFLLIAL